MGDGSYSNQILWTIPMEEADLTKATLVEILVDRPLTVYRAEVFVTSAIGAATTAPIFTISHYDGTTDTPKATVTLVAADAAGVVRSHVNTSTTHLLPHSWLAGEYIRLAITTAGSNTTGKAYWQLWIGQCSDGTY